MPRGKKAAAAAAGAEGVADETPKQEPTLMDTEADGQKVLPGHEYEAIEELVKKGLEIVKDKAAHAKLTKKLTEHKPIIRALCKKYEQYFTEDENVPGTKWYRAGGVKIKYVHTEEEDVTVSEDSKTVNVQAY